MKRSRPWMWGLTVVAAFLITSCGEPVSEEHVVAEPPATVEEVEEPAIPRVTLTERAAERVDLQTAQVEMEGQRLVVPFSAVIVDPEGTFWVYTNPESLVFLRHEIAIEREEGDRVFLTEGPPPGTNVVTVGVPELYGAETGVDH